MLLYRTLNRIQNDIMSSSLWQIQTRVHNETGYWGPVDANHQFCEPHYVTTHYLAEPYNAISSFIYIIVAYAAFRRTKGAAWIQVMCLWLAVIGVGSFLFHGEYKSEIRSL